MNSNGLIIKIQLTLKQNPEVRLKYMEFRRKKKEKKKKNLGKK